MHTTIDSMPHGERRMHERRRLAGLPLWQASGGLRISWGGVNGGVFIALGTVILLAALGIAVGISVVNPGSIDAGAVGTGAAIWSGVSLLVALFIGGFASTRLGATTDSTTGFFEGALVWVVSVLLMTFLASSGIGMVASGAFSIVGGVTQAATSVVQGTADELSSGDVNQITARLRSQETASAVATATGLPQAEVSATLTDLAGTLQQLQNDPAAVAAEVRRTVTSMYSEARSRGLIAQRAEAIQPEAVTAAWITFGALVLSLIAAVWGGMMGRRRPTSARSEEHHDAFASRPL